MPLLLALLAAPALAGCVQLGDPLANPDDPRVRIHTSHGVITVQLYARQAPITVGNFLNYTRAGFYEQTIFHRVIQGFVIQGGGLDPNGTEKATLYPPIPLEVHPELTHRDGCLGMAREAEIDSATAQWYICDGPQHGLDDGQRQRERGERGYAVFGKVEDGLPVVRFIAQVATDDNDRPVRNVLITRVEEVRP